MLPLRVGGSEVPLGLSGRFSASLVGPRITVCLSGHVPLRIRVIEVSDHVAERSMAVTISARTTWSMCVRPTRRPPLR